MPQDRFHVNVTIVLVNCGEMEGNTLLERMVNISRFRLFPILFSVTRNEFSDDAKRFNDDAKRLMKTPKGLMATPRGLMATPKGLMMTLWQ